MKKIFPILILGMIILCGLVSNFYRLDITETNVHASMVTPTNFTIIALPDTQYYAESYPTIFINQTQWIVNHKDALNIVYVTGEGDITDIGIQDIQWQHADAAYTLLEDLTTTHLPYGIPYTIPPGNHDQPTTLFNQYFGVSRFTGRSYYGGHYSTTNNNHYVLFNASGISFIAIALDYNPSTAALNWADGVLQTYNNRKAIVIEHCILNVDASWDGNGQMIYDTLKHNPNLFLMLCGHNHGENRRTETYNGHTINILLADYQNYRKGGNGYLRIMTFYPATEQIKVKTYSPYLDQYQTDANSQFNLNYNTTPSPLTIESITDGLGIKAVIKNTGTVDVKNVSWKIQLDGGIILVGKSKTGTVDIAAGDTITIEDFVFGFGKTTITVTVGDVEQTAAAIVLLTLVLNVA
ncbi:3',5'-cyclic adenosine monophosphate phosphodiesterase CpdA [uncultured archaeon]|nr:3',5'-cyclic adenosine monophosphate phosphodiesterase CpdA [uncultured archaeon]